MMNPQSIRFRSVRGAERSADDLHAALIAGGIEISLSACREQMSRWLGQQNWHALIAAIDAGNDAGAHDAEGDRRKLTAAMATLMLAERRDNPIAFMTAEQIVEHVEGTLPLSTGLGAWRRRALHSLYGLAVPLVWLRDHRGLTLDMASLRRHFSIETLTRMALPASIVGNPYRDLPAEIRQMIVRDIVTVPAYPADLERLLKSNGAEIDHELVRNPMASIRFPETVIVHHDGYLKQILGGLKGTGNGLIGAWLTTVGVEAFMSHFDAHMSDLYRPDASALPGMTLNGRMTAVVESLIWLRDHRAMPMTVNSIHQHLSAGGMTMLALPKDTALPRYRPLPSELRDQALSVCRTIPGMAAFPPTIVWPSSPFDLPKVILVEPGERFEQEISALAADVLARIAANIEQRLETEASPRQERGQTAPLATVPGEMRSRSDHTTGNRHDMA